MRDMWNTHHYKLTGQTLSYFEKGVTGYDAQ